VQDYKRRIKCFEKNETWVITQLPKDKKLAGYKRVFKIKYNNDGTIERYKVRLVAKDYTQM
jgi:hypothetical protein